MKEVGRVRSPRKRPLVLVSPGTTDEQAPLRGLMPIAAAHHEDTHGWLPVDAIVSIQQPAIEPAVADGIHVHGRLGAEVRNPREGPILPGVCPWPNRQALLALLRLRQLHIIQIRDLGAPRVVPSGEMP